MRAGIQEFRSSGVTGVQELQNDGVTGVQESGVAGVQKLEPMANKMGMAT
jgi:hypothetical protein